MKDVLGSLDRVFRGSTTRLVRDAQRHWPLVRGWCARSPRFGLRVLLRSHCYCAASAHSVLPQGFERPPIGCSQPLGRCPTPPLSKQSP
jgi:hypothetical protein